MSLRRFFSLILVLNLAILIFLRPIGDWQKTSKQIQNSEIPQIMFKNFYLFDLGSNNIIETIVSGQIGEVFRNGRYVIKKVGFKLG